MLRSFSVATSKAAALTGAPVFWITFGTTAGATSVGPVSIGGLTHPKTRLSVIKLGIKKCFFKIAPQRRIFTFFWPKQGLHPQQIQPSLTV